MISVGACRENLIATHPELFIEFELHAGVGYSGTRGSESARVVVDVLHI